MPPEKKKSAFATFLSFVFDLTFLALLIWFFSSTENQTNFWSTISNAVCKSVIVVAEALHQKPQGQENSSPALQPQTQAQTPVPQSKTTELPEGLPPAPQFIPPPLPTEEQLAGEVPGDCYPPEPSSPDEADAPPVARLFYQPPPLPEITKQRKGHGKTVQFARKKLRGVPFYQVTLDLNDPECFLVIRLPNKARSANSASYSAGHESFDSFVKRYPAAVQVNGTFFSKDDQERVMGNMVSEGKTLKYSPWENYGTTLSLRKGDCLEMVTARAEGKPDWSKYWFSLTCGPRLLKEGQVWVNADLEGFRDPHVLGAGSRSAIGFPKSRDKIYLITFLQGLSLKEEAKLMKEIGCWEAMNLDGGASKALSHDGAIVMKPGRALTNVLVVYDAKHKAPSEIFESWQRFQQNATVN